MTEVGFPYPKGYCRACELPEVNDALTATNGNVQQAFGLLQDMGVAISRNTIHKHVRQSHLSLPHQKVKRNMAQVKHDLAELVRDKAVEGVQSGKLEVTTAHGLAAQALIDKRAEKQRDREFVLNLARLLSGAAAPTPADVIEAEYQDLGDGTLLAPPELRTTG